MQTSSLRRGDVVIVDLQGAIGAEIQNDKVSNVRACIVIQNDRGNAASPTTIVVPLSDAMKNQRTLPILVPLSSDELGPGGKNSVAHCEQIRTVDAEARVKQIVGHVGREALARIEKAIAVSLGLGS